MARTTTNRVRIIGGVWRGQRLAFPAGRDLRPTADRRRETLFNWLAPELVGARCLDLFAGSGALGFEAASRGAQHVILVEAARSTAQALAANRDRLGAANAEVIHAPAARYLGGSPEPFDIVFLDPPFARPELGAEACERLSAGWLAREAAIYLEQPARSPCPQLPPAWRVTREMSGGDVIARLCRAG